MAKRKIKADNYYGLYELTLSRFGNSFVPEYNWSTMGWVAGTIDSMKFRMTFDDNGSTLFLSVEKDGEYLFDELIPFISDIMAEEYPVCCFDLRRKKLDEYEEPVTTLMWNVDDPDKKISELINEGLGNGAKYENFQLLNGKEILDYQDDDIKTYEKK